MSFTSDAKIEITKNKVNASSLRSLLSGFLRTAGSIESKNGMYGFSATGETEVLLYIAKCIKRAYKEDVEVVHDTAKKDRSKLKLISENSLSILVDLGILRVDDGLDIVLNIDEKLVNNENNFKAYLMGAFLGTGSVTVPDMDINKKTSYHLEFVFSKYITANDFCSVLAENEFFPKLVERKDRFVVYFKGIEDIERILGLCGANSSYLYLMDLQIQKGIRNSENRKMNCEMSNLNKVIDASIKQREEIKLINEVIGLDMLPEELASVAKARLSNESMSYSELAELLGITKSCLVHRLKKLSNIAKTL